MKDLHPAIERIRDDLDQLRRQIDEARRTVMATRQMVERLGRVRPRRF